MFPPAQKKIKGISCQIIENLLHTNANTHICCSIIYNRSIFLDFNNEIVNVHAIQVLFVVSQVSAKNFEVQ